MKENLSSQPVQLEAKSPFALRVNLGRDVPESDVRTALATGEMGFLHSFTTGSTVDGPGVRVVAWTTGCQWRCKYCHNPDTWNMMNGIPVTLARASEELEIGELDFLIAPMHLSSGHPTEVLFEDTWTCIAWSRPSSASVARSSPRTSAPGRS